MRRDLPAALSLFVAVAAGAGCQPDPGLCAPLLEGDEVVLSEGRQALALVVDFMNRSMVGRTVTTGKIREPQLGGGPDTQVTSQVSWPALLIEPLGFALEMTQRLTTETTAAGSAPQVTTVDYSYRYELAAQASTGELIGIDRTILSTDPGRRPFGPYYTARAVPLVRGVRIDEVTAPYADTYLDGQLGPGGTCYSTRYTLAPDGKLRKRERLATFRVDPATGERTPVGQPAILDYTE